MSAMYYTFISQHAFVVCTREQAAASERAEQDSYYGAVFAKIVVTTEPSGVH
jgi:hypothetical protein